MQHFSAWSQSFPLPPCWHRVPSLPDCLQTNGSFSHHTTCRLRRDRNTQCRGPVLEILVQSDLAKSHRTQLAPCQGGEQLPEEEHREAWYGSSLACRPPIGQRVHCQPPLMLKPPNESFQQQKETFNITNQPLTLGQFALCIRTYCPMSLGIYRALSAPYPYEVSS